MTHPMETVTITALAAGGAGVGRLENGMTLFAGDTYPGDVAQVRLEKVKKRHAEGSLARLVTPSPNRRTPECGHVADCGGCPWMGLDYDTQVEWKKTIVTGALERIGKLSPPPARATASPVALGYRHRARMKGAVTAEGYSFAFRRRGSHQLAPITSCAVAHPKINSVMASLAGYLSENPKTAEAIAETLLETDGEKCRALFFPAGPLGASGLSKITEAVAGLDGAAVIQGSKISAEAGDIWLAAKTAGGLTLAMGPGAFAQANLPLNPALAEAVVQASGLAAGGRGLDLFCGAGNYSIPLAAKGVAMTGVDLSAFSIASADRSRKLHSIFNAQFSKEDCQEAVEGFAGGNLDFDAVIVNPPRAGAGAVFQKALGLAREKLVYVACDPAPLARDAQAAEMMGFALAGVEVFDMFPHTPHMETVAVFQRR